MKTPQTQKQVEVQIMGQSYLLGCAEGGEARLLESVEKVDTAMCRIRDAGKVKARDRIAVLAALNLAFDVSERVPAKASKQAGTLNGASAHNGVGDPLAHLIERLDKALAGDGQLL